MRKIATPAFFLIITGLAALSFVVSLSFGSVDYSRSEVWEVVRQHLSGGTYFDQSVDAVVWELRAPRGLLALIVGAGLALAGVTMQTLVRNPLADPYLLGISSGASVGATAVLVFGVLSGFGLYSLSVGALIGALVATLTVYAVTIAQGGLTPLRLILSGVVLSSAFSALASFLVFKGLMLALHKA
ncbi:ABC transporter (iron.B12.siderophore.hemin), permease component [Corynebacterium pseudotuberculosis]|nr:ABC transporter (iron.B12.siderophore.hemin), permease component [Corynebacterium pseudotuberculosis]